MKKVLLFSFFLVLGLVFSQCLPIWLESSFLVVEKGIKTLCLSAWLLL